jgi:hypothetical protein
LQHFFRVHPENVAIQDLTPLASLLEKPLAPFSMTTSNRKRL